MPVAASASERGRGVLGAGTRLKVRVKVREVRDPVGSKCRESKTALVVLRYYP